MGFRKKNKEVVVFEDPRGISGVNVDYTEEVIDLEKNKKRAKSLFRSITIYSFTFLLTIATLYLALAGTLLVAIPNESNEDFSHTWVQRNKFKGGIPHTGQFVYGSLTQEIDSSFLGKILQTVTTPESAGVLINVAGPVGDIRNEGNQIFFEGEDTGFVGAIDSISLAGEYLMQCHSGACVPGEYYIVPEGNLVGEPTHLINFPSFRVEEIR